MPRNAHATSSGHEYDSGDIFVRAGVFGEHTAGSAVERNNGIGGTVRRRPLNAIDSRQGTVSGEHKAVALSGKRVGNSRMMLSGWKFRPVAAQIRLPSVLTASVLVRIGLG